VSCKGLHCPGCGDGGGGVVLALIVVLLVAVAIARPIEHAVDDVLHVLIIAACCLAGTAVAAGAAYAAVRLYRRHHRTPEHAPAVLAPPVRPEAVPARTAPRAIAAPQPELHLHVHGVSADDLAAIIRSQHARLADREGA
jgi:hypothetical protein